MPCGEAGEKTEPIAEVDADRTAVGALERSVPNLVEGKVGKMAAATEIPADNL